MRDQTHPKELIHRALNVLLVVGLVSFHSLPARAQSENPEWMDELRRQLEVEQGCDVADYLKTIEQQGPLYTTFSATVQCVDGRQFDAEKKDTDKKFVITACGRSVC